MMSKQKKIQDDLSAYLDGELSSGRAEQVRRALADDADLSGELEDIRAVRNLLAALPRTRAPRGLADSVLQQAERASLVHTPPGQADSRAIRWMPYAAAAAILVVAATLGMMLYSELWPTDVHDTSDRNKTDVAAHTPTAPGPGPVVGKGAGPLGKDGGAGVRIAGNELDAKRLTGRSDDYPNAAHAKGGRRAGIVRLGNLPEAEINEVIYTPTVAHTQRQIETFLARNAIEPVVTAAATQAIVRKPTDIRGRGNYYSAYRVTADQVRIRIDAATPEQIERIRGEIDKIRMEQRVSQVTIPGETIAFHRILKPAALDGKRRLRDGKLRPRPKPADGRAYAKPGTDGGEGIAKGDTRVGGKTGWTDAPRTGKVEQDDKAVDEAMRSKVAKQPGPVRPKDTEQVADGQSPARGDRAQTPPKKTADEERHGRKFKGKGAPDRTDPSTTPPGRDIARKETRLSKNGEATTALEVNRQQTVDNVKGLKQKYKDDKALAERQDRIAANFRIVLNRLLYIPFHERKGEDKDTSGALKSAPRPSKATTRSAPADGPAGRKEGEAQLARQSKRSALQAGVVGQATTRAAAKYRLDRGKGDGGHLAGANVQAMIITLNFRAVTDSTSSRRQLDAAKNDATTSQKNNSK